MPAFRRVPTYELSEDAERTLVELSELTNGTPPPDLIAEAIGLLEIVVKSRRDGYDVAVVDAKGVPVKRIELELPIGR